MLNPPSSSGTDACLFWLAETVRRATITVRLRLRLYSDGTTTTNRLYDGDSMSDHDTTRHDTTRHDNDTTRHDNNDDATTTRHDTTTTRSRFGWHCVIHPDRGVPFVGYSVPSQLGFFSSLARWCSPPAYCVVQRVVASFAFTHFSWLAFGVPYCHTVPAPVCTPPHPGLPHDILLAVGAYSPMRCFCLIRELFLYGRIGAPACWASRPFRVAFPVYLLSACAAGPSRLFSQLVPAYHASVVLRCSCRSARSSPLTCSHSLPRSLLSFSFEAIWLFGTYDTLCWCRRVAFVRTGLSSVPCALRTTCLL